jgi:hypothetical membrane protein
MKRSLMFVGGAAGIVAPIWFITLVVVQGILNPSYSHIAMPISALAALDTGWMQNVNFYVFSALVVVLVVALHFAIEPGRWPRAGVALLLCGAIGVMVAATFPWIAVDGIPRETPSHVVGAIMTFAGTSLGYIMLSRRLREDVRWSALSPYVRIAGSTMLALFVLFGAFAVDESGPAHPWAGLLQRVIVTIWFSCLIVLSLRLWARARSAT